MKIANANSVHARRRLIALLLGLIGGQHVSACNDRPEELQACYPVDEYNEVYESTNPYPTPAGFCQWSNDELARSDGSPPEALPDLPPEVQLAAEVYCFAPEAGQVCDACPAEDTDALLREQRRQHCDNEITYFARGCYLRTEYEDGRPMCCYKALIGPACIDPVR